jgi:cytochrome c oxidase subunit 1
MTYLNPKNELFRPEWVPTTLLGLAGGIIMFIAGVLFFIVFFGTVLKKKSTEGELNLPVSEALHDEDRIPLFDQFKPWLVTMAVILVLAYTPALLNVMKNTGPVLRHLRPIIQCPRNC